MMRRPILFTALSLFLSSIAAGCGDDGGGGADASAGGSGADAGADEVDAGGGEVPDAAAGADADVDTGGDAGTGASALGRSCSGAGQGDCPDGYECINLQGGSGPWCTLRCQDQDDTSCEEGYDGPGHPACILTVTVNDETFRACSVVCDVEDEAFEDSLCPSDTCDGTCPGELACEGAINNTNGGERVATSCT